MLSKQDALDSGKGEPNSLNLVIKHAYSMNWNIFYTYFKIGKFRKNDKDKILWECL